MKVGRWKSSLAAAMATTLLATMTAYPLTATAQSVKGIMMYEDTRTGAFYSKPGKGRIAIGHLYLDAEKPPASTAGVQEQVQKEVKKHDDELRAEFMQNQTTLLKKNSDLSQQVAEMKPAWKDFGEHWFKKVSIGTTVYADYRYLTHTGFGPGFTDTPQEWPGPGNNGFSAFDLSRVYLNFKFTPTEDFMMRVTPDVYSTIGTGSADTVGKSTSWGSQLDGNLGVRLKYAFLDYNTFFKKVLAVTAMADDKFTFGQQQDPLIDWEENLWGYRYITTVPWNYLSLSSTFVGVSMKGPIKFHETQYVDYDFGVYNNANFHQFEQGNTKTVMGRITVNPLGAKSRYDSLGITAFGDWGWGNTAPDLSSSGGGKQTWRDAFLIHYNAKSWGVIGEYDIGKNAFSSGNLYSGSGPFTGAGSTFAPWNTMVTGILNNGQATEQGFAFLGHVEIPGTPFTVVGLFQQFLPNTKADKNPLDLQRYMVGVEYKVNKYLRVAVDSQNLMYSHGQFSFPSESFGHTVVPTTAFAVPRDTHATYLNIEFNY